MTDVTPGSDVEPVETPASTAPGEVIARQEGMFGVSGTGDTSGFGGLTRSVELPGSSTPLRQPLPLVVLGSGSEAEGAT